MDSARPRLRWWPAALIAAAWLGGAGWLWLSDWRTGQSRTMALLGLSLGALFLLFLWFALFSRLAWRRRLSGLLVLAALGTAAGTLLEIRGVDGDLKPILALRWSPRPGAAQVGAVPAQARGPAPTRAGPGGEAKTSAEPDPRRGNPPWSPPTEPGPGQARGPAPTGAGPGGEAKTSAEPASSRGNPPWLPSSPAAQPAPAAAIDAASFPQFLGPDRDGRIAGVELSRDWQARPPRELWRRPVGAGWAGFSVAGGMAFTLEQEGEEEVATAYELATGKRLWRHADRTRYETTVGGVGPRSVPTVAGDRVFVMGATSHLRALDRESGRLLWQRDLKQGEGKSPPWGKANSPLVVGEQVIVQAGGETGSALAAFDAASGRPLWQGGKDPGSSSYSSPVLLAPAGEAQVVSFNSDSVSAHDPADGHPLWRYPWPAEQPNVSTPLLLPGDRLFASSGYGVGSKLLQLSRGEAGEWTAKLVWESPRLKAKFTNVVFSDGYLYGLDDGTLVCLDPGTGERCWKSGRYGHGQVLLIGKTLLVTTEEGELVLVAPDPREHRELARLSVLGGKSWNPPAFASPYLLWRDDREAVCLELPLEQPGR